MGPYTKSFALLLCALPLVLAACDDSASNKPSEVIPSDSGTPTTDGGSPTDGGAQPTCVTMPQSHIDIINAPTDASFVDKKSTPPRVTSEGCLPPLP